MIAVAVTKRSDDVEVPPLETEGFVPFDGSPLAITRRCNYHRLAPVGWRLADPLEWEILHRATGFNLGDCAFPSQEAAMEALHSCDPSFPAWQMVTSKEPCDAMKACAVKFRMAMRQHGVAA